MTECPGVGSRDVAKIRLGMLGLVALGTIAMLAELALIGHTEDSNQLIPLGVGGAGMAAVLWTVLAPRAGALRFLQLVMLLYIGSGVVGVTLHALANAEFQREMDPAIAGVNLVLKVFEATSPPAMAPALMVQLGLLGLLFTYKHPALTDGTGAGG
jgi:hypothetical protein